MELENPLEINKNIKINHLVMWAFVSAFFAIVFDYLFFEKASGISVTVYGVLHLGALFYFCRSNRLPILRRATWLAVPFLFFCTMPAILASPILVGLDVLAAVGIFLLLVRGIAGDAIFKFTFLDYLLTAVLWPLKFLQHGIIGLAKILRGARDIPTGKGRQVLIGVLTAIPVLVFFGALFFSADLAFRQFITNSFGFHVPETAIPHAVLMGAVFIMCLGGFTFLLLKPADKTTADIAELLGLGNKRDENRKLEISIFLSLIAALFLLFIVFQVHYLFGGAANITFGEFTYAEYARKGFWELLVVAFSTLLILLAVDNYTSHHEDRKRWFVIPGVVIIAEVIVIIISAFKRLALYQSAYGMTQPRIYVFAFIILLAAIFILLALKLLLKKRHYFFATGSFILLVLTLGALNFLNPDKYIAQYNINRYRETGKIDSLYLTSLSADAVPVILEQYTPPTEEEKNIIYGFLWSQADNAAKAAVPWQSYNISRYRTLEKVDTEKIRPAP